MKTTVSKIMFAISLTLFASCSKAPESKTESDSNQAQQKSQKETRKKAQAGVGKKGQKLKDHHGPLATPVKAYFRAEQELIFMNVDRALQMHEIQFGYPKSHEEYMEKIIRANAITLPELPDGDRYEYNPETHQLMVISNAGDP